MLWRWGGMTLGTITGLLGRNAIMACTDAIETAVARVSFSPPLPSLSLSLYLGQKCNHDLHRCY